MFIYMKYLYNEKIIDENSNVSSYLKQMKALAFWWLIVEIRNMDRQSSVIVKKIIKHSNWRLLFRDFLVPNFKTIFFSSRLNFQILIHCWGCREFKIFYFFTFNIFICFSSENLTIKINTTYIRQLSTTYLFGISSLRLTQELIENRPWMFLFFIFFMLAPFGALFISLFSISTVHSFI